MLKRPKPEETEEDLLALQKKFLSSQEPSSTRLSTSGNTRPVLKSSKSTTPQNLTQGYNYVVKKDDSRPSVIIQERKPLIHNTSQGLHISQSLYNKTGFPKPIILSNYTQKKPSVGKKSLFAQQFDSQNGGPSQIKNSEVSLQENKPTLSTNNESNDKEKRVVITLSVNTAQKDCSDSSAFKVSRLITGEGLTCVSSNSDTPLVVEKELETIHKENSAMLASMSELELVEEQLKMKKLLGPQLVSFIQSRSKPIPPPSPQVKEMTTELNQSSSVQSKWIHMDVKEDDKMEWMSDIHIDPNKQPEFYREIRFSFTGLVIPHNVGVTIPSHLALHHHGDEPECGGYTLGELTVLACSSVLQQRVLSLQTLSHIVKRCIHGEYIGLIEGHPLTILIDSDIPSLFRNALDESIDSLQAVAIHGIHSLLTSPAEDQLLSWYTSTTFHSSLLPNKGKSKEENEEESVKDILKRDVIRGLLGMMLLPRLRYILEVCRPQEGVVNNILEILIKVGRHSLQSASEILKCPRLMNVIISHFLPKVQTRDGDSYERPHPLALRLMGCLCRAGKYIAKDVLAVHSLLPILLKYVLASDDHTHNINLSIEASRTWTVLLRYELATEEISNVYPILLNAFSLTSFHCTTSCERQRLASLYNLIAASIIATPIVRPHPLIDPTLKHLVMSLNEWEDVFNERDVTLDAVQYITGLLNIVNTYYTQLCIKTELRGDPFSLLEEVVSVSNSVAMVILKSKLCSFICKTVISLLGIYNTSSTTFTPFSSFLPFSLHSKPAVYSSQEETPLVDYTSLSHNHCVLIVFSQFLHSTLSLILSLSQLHHGMTDLLCSLLLKEDSVWLNVLMEFVITTNCSLVVNVSISYYPVYSFLITIVKLLINTSLIESIDVSILKLVHSTSLCLLSHSPPGHETYVKELLNSTIFNPILYRDVLQDTSPITTPTLLDITPSTLSVIKDTYCGSINDSFNWKSHNFNTNTNSQLLPPMTGFILPSDWPYFLLIGDYTEKSSYDIGLTYCSNCLSFVLFLEHYRNDMLQAIPSCERVKKIMNIFMINTELFHDSCIKFHLSSFLHCYSQPSFLSSLDWTQTSSTSSFQQFYTSLLDQFGAVSYGNKLFATFLLFPLQQKDPLCFRKDFWIDHIHILRLITLTPKELPIPMNSFLYPVEQDFDLLKQYIKLLVSETIIEKRNPFLFQVASNHIHSIVTSHPVKGVASSDKTHTQIVAMVESIPNKVLKAQLLSPLL